MEASVRQRVEWIEATCGSDQAMTQFIIDFINCDNDDKLKKKKKRLHLTNEVFILVLDNVETVILNELPTFKAFLTRLDNECKDLKIILTTYRSIGCLDNQYFPPMKLVRRLSDIDSVSMFLEHAGSISHEEMLDFMIADANYPFHEILASLKNTPKPAMMLTTAERNQILRLLYDERIFAKAFAKHDLFRLLCGNPYSIMLLATIHHNPAIYKDNKN